MTTPFQLDKGVLLENKDILIPWGTLADDLINYDSPKEVVGPDGRTFYWNNSLCLGGLRCQIAAIFYKPSSQFKGGNWSETLHFIFVNLDYEPGLSLDELFHRTYHTLKHSLGEPTEYYDDYAHHGQPLASWKFPQVEVVLVFDEKAEYWAVDIKNIPIKL